MSAAHVYVLSQPVREIRSVQAETLIPTISLRNWTRDILQESFLINSNLVSPDASNNCLKAEENDVGIKGASIVAWKEDACIQLWCLRKRSAASGAIKLEDGKIEVEESKCNYCGRCAKACPTDAWDVTTGYLVSFGGLFGNTHSQKEKKSCR